MAKAADITKLRRENEILRQELSRLQAKSSRKEGLLRPAVTTASKKSEGLKDFKIDFKYLRNDLVRTFVLTTFCIGVIVSLAVLGPRIPQLRQLISTLSI